MPEKSKKSKKSKNQNVVMDTDEQQSLKWNDTHGENKEESNVV